MKITGVHVNDLPIVLGRNACRTDLDTANHSRLIFSDGFSAGQCLFALLAARPINIWPADAR